MLPDRVSNQGPLTYESGALPIALHGRAQANKCLQGRLSPCLHQSKQTNCVLHVFPLNSRKIQAPYLTGTQIII